jgi:hypothetical protein
MKQIYMCFSMWWKFKLKLVGKYTWTGKGQVNNNYEKIINEIYN